MTDTAGINEHQDCQWSELFRFGSGLVHVETTGLEGVQAGGIKTRLTCLGFTPMNGDRGDDRNIEGRKMSKGPRRGYVFFLLMHLLY